jgi:hypothetical protein
MRRQYLYAAALAAFIVPVDCTARGEWPQGPYTEWFKNLQRPDSTGGPHPEDQWYAWLDESWEKIPPEKMNPEYAPDGRAYLFLLANTIQCFVRPKRGL